eukprot:8972960-Alexandrium_andersonii.AAC.1
MGTPSSLTPSPAWRTSSALTTRSGRPRVSTCHSPLGQRSSRTFRPRRPGDAVETAGGRQPLGAG